MKNTKEIKKPLVRNNGVLTDAFKKALQKAKEEEMKIDSAKQNKKKESNKN